MNTIHRGPWTRGARRRSRLVLVLALAVVASLVAGSTAWAQGKTITLSMLAGFKEDVLRANLPEFEKKTGIKVLIDAAPIGDLYKKQVLSLSTAARYDVMFMDEPWIPPLSEFLLPLTERARGLRHGGLRADDRWRRARSRATQYALPVDPNMQLLVYRKDLFEQKGMKPPATWDELLAAAKAFTDPAKEQYGIAVTASSDIQTCLYMLAVDVVPGSRAGRRPRGSGGVDTPGRPEGRRDLPGAPEVRAAERPELHVPRRQQGDPDSARRPWPSSGRRAPSRWRTRPARAWPASSATRWCRRRCGRRRCAACGRSGSPRTAQPGRRLGVREVAQQQGVRARGDQVPERHVRHSQPPRLGAPGPRDQGRPPVRRGAPREPAESPRSARGFASSPTSRSTSGSPPAS